MIGAFVSCLFKVASDWGNAIDRDRQTRDKELSERYNAGWMAGRDNGYYQSFIDTLYGVNEYCADPKSSPDAMVIWKRAELIPNPHKGVK